MSGENPCKLVEERCSRNRTSADQFAHFTEEMNMTRFVLSILSLTLSIAVAHGQTAQPAAPGSGGQDDVLYQPFQLQNLTPQNVGSGVAWFDNGLNPSVPQGFLYVGGGANENPGLVLAPLDDASRVHLRLPKDQGLIATSVVPQGAAGQAGVAENDILLTLGDAPLAKPEDVEKQLKSSGEKPLGLVLLHQGQRKSLQVQPHVKVYFGPVPPAQPAFWIGVTASNVEPALRAHLKLPADRGLMATTIFDGGPAAKAGFKVNDILLSMGGKPLRDQSVLVELVQKNGEKSVAIEIVREGSPQTIEVIPERRKNVSFTANVLPALIVNHPVNYSVVHPGVVLQNNEALGGLRIETAKDFTNPADKIAQPEAGSLNKRLDSMGEEIKELRKAVEELNKVLRDRK
jgi:membrane-associated protease RseP (regulator of RpoE activity)